MVVAPREPLQPPVSIRCKFRHPVSAHASAGAQSIVLTLACSCFCFCLCSCSCAVFGLQTRRHGKVGVHIHVSMFQCKCKLNRPPHATRVCIHAYASSLLACCFSHLLNPCHVEQHTAHSEPPPPPYYVHTA
ncbi:hypothetical protein GGP41_002020 [Bipolaris sorokiniana]|uniref:Uncharacterized protein n=1 Tax=Cochliobolus sativus TaxID=45130 RepID=A0A8H5ZQF0_COCSA|nr:hypothetical protein GGP41_002020 [Bipolaris sorokiniana]